MFLVSSHGSVECPADEHSSSGRNPARVPRDAGIAFASFMNVLRSLFAGASKAIDPHGRGETSPGARMFLIVV
jgi:hypothetical protein